MAKNLAYREARSRLLPAETGVPAPPVIALPDVSPPEVRGKFLYANGKKIWIKGVTYGAFMPDDAGREYTFDEIIENDFSEMAASGINAVRIPHTTPPRSLLDIAARYGLRVMVGLSGEQFIGYLIDRKRGAPDIEAVLRDKVESVAGHPALLCYAIGNEIPAPVVRWLGRTCVEKYIRKLYDTVKKSDQNGIVTYVNYPTTEYLDLPFLDLVAFNVYLETQEELASYLPRLHNIAGNRPLVMTELGLDSLRNGEEAQATCLDWQVRTAFASGCVGTFVFSWTDEWYRGTERVEDWKFGVTTNERQPKPALATLSSAYMQVPFSPDLPWPRISVVVCSYNGEATIRDTLEGLKALDYPREKAEFIVIDDGSTDRTSEIAAQYDVQLIRTDNRGLSAARNLGLEKSTGEIVAYIDDDAYPDPHWLQYLARAFAETGHVGIGGPNIVPDEDGMIAQCVARSPGGPVHVLVTDDIADHIPGCNMAFRRRALEEIGGFDPRFRVAGDDVDICWQLQSDGGTLGFCAAAVVWHHRRNSVRAFWHQQRGYGRAEALLEAKWPHKFNAAGHQRHTGRIYGIGVLPLFRRRALVYHGQWGTAPFQTLQQPGYGVLQALTLMPEWYLLIFGLLVLTAVAWAGGTAGWIILAVLSGAAIITGVAQAWLGARREFSNSVQGARKPGVKAKLLIFLLHLLQPVARLLGRLTFGLTPWRSTRPHAFRFPRKQEFSKWSQDGFSALTGLADVENYFSERKIVYAKGNAYSRWDFEVPGGALGKSRMLFAVEEHSGGAAFVRARCWPSPARVVWVLEAVALSGGLLSAIYQYSLLAWSFAMLGSATAVLAFKQCGESFGAAMKAVEAVIEPASND